MIRRLLIDQKNWDEVAVIEDGQSVTYRALVEKAAAVQRLLPQEKGEHIAILLPNGSEYIAAFFAAVHAGLTAFPLSPTLTKHEIAPLLAQASVRAIITAGSFRPLVCDLEAEGTSFSRVIYIDEIAADALKGAPLAASVGADEPMVLLATSGTTGKSKIVQLSDNNVAASALGYIERMEFDEADEGITKFIVATPFSSAYGILMICVCFIQSYPLIVMPDGFTLDALYETAERHRASHYEGGALPVQMMERLAGRPIPYDVSTFTCIGFGGSKVSGDTFRKLYAAYPGMRFFQGYGMTEASPMLTKFYRKRGIKPDSVGLAIAGLTIAVEVDGVITTAPHTMGEIVAKGPNIMLGYYQNEEATNEVLRDGYLHTGDIGYLDEDGCVYLCGRKKNIIIVRGLNVHPEEVEECILRSALAEDCYVYGHTDASGHETVWADVVPARPDVTAEAIIAYCRAHLAGHKQPQRVNLCGKIIKNATGKTERTRGEGR